MKVSQASLGYFLITTFIIIFGLLIDDSEVITILATIQLIACFIYVKSNKHVDTILTDLVLGAIFIFYFGQLFTYYFITQTSLIDFVVIERLTEQEIIDSSRYALLTFSLFFMGCVFNKNKHSDENKDTIIKNKYVKICWMIGLILFIISIVPTIIYEGTILKASYSYGYAAGRLAASVSGIADDLSRTCKASIILLMVGSKNKKLRATIIMCCYCIFCIVKMVVYGERGYAAINLILTLWTYKYLVRDEFEKRNISIKTIIIGFVLVITFAVIGEMRDTAFSNWSSIQVADILENNAFTREFVECGASLLTVGYIIRFIPSVYPFLYGKTLISSLLCMLPNISSIISEAADDTATAIIFAVRGSQTSIGGSFIADLYLNFGIYGVIFSILLGYLTISVIRGIKNKNINLLYKVCLINVLSSLIWLVRGSFINVPRELEFTVLPVLVLYQVLLLISRRNQYKIT